jgi:hypothetical protein
MHYQISRNGQTYGPYTLEDLQRYLASGNILPTDLAKNEDMADWVPVSDILAGVTGTPVSAFPTPGFSDPASAPAYGQSAIPYGQPAMYGQPDPAALAASTYPDPPNLHWGLVLLFGLLTCTVFMWVWNLIVAAWLKRVQPNATSLFFYIGAAVLLFVQLAVTLPYTMHHMQPGVHATADPIGGLIGLGVWVLRLIARFMQRAALEEHFNGPEPVGLELNPVMTFFFGGLYFQYHINRIMTMKQAARYGAGRGF